MNHRHSELLDSTVKCENAGMGITNFTKYYPSRQEPHGEVPDIAFHLKLGDAAANPVRMYGLFTSHGSKHIAKYASNQMVYELLYEHKISSESTKEIIGEALSTTFESIDKYIMDQGTDFLSKKAVLEFEHAMENIPRIEHMLHSNSTALVVLMVEKQLYVLNCGNSRLLLISMANEKYQCDALTTPHEYWNEKRRLDDAGIDLHDQPFLPTRALGDISHRKEFISDPKQGYIISDPDVLQIEIDPSCKYLLLASRGVIQSISEVNERDGKTVDVNQQIMEYFLHEKNDDYIDSLNSIAQGTLDLISRLHYEKCNSKKGIESREGMSLVIVDLSTPNTKTEYFISQLSETQQNFSQLNDIEVDPYVDCNDLESRISSEEIQKICALFDS